jgi:alkylhydroperoxidase/carboxymuconolactone decarboxylase family protein YurZ
MAEDARRARAMATYAKMGWGDNGHLREIDETFWTYTTDIVFGEVWSRPGLPLRERELITLCALLAAKADGIAIHMRNAHKLGITFDEIREVILQCTVYLGMPYGVWGIRKLKEVMDEEAKKKPVAGKT